MRNTDRRQWLKTIGLSSGFLLMGGLESMGMSTEFSPYSKNNIARLNFNENPFGPSALVRQTIADNFDIACRYPSGVLSELVALLASKEGVSKDHIVITGGSTEGLRAAGITYGLAGGEIIAATPTFQAMLRYAKNFGAHIHQVPLDANMVHNLETMERRVTSKTGLIYICNPNNPTGTIIEKNILRDFCTSIDHKAVIFSDEAYYDFITIPDYPSMVELVKEDRNIIVSKTFSKAYGMAGMRIGYMIARPDIAKRLKANIMANTNILAIKAAVTALNDDDFYKFSLLKNLEGKKRIYSTLDDLGLEYVQSHTNFIFFKSSKPIQELQKSMLAENVMIGRPFPPFYEWARISTGKLADVDRFGVALKKVLS